jgi:hypothetical protein
MRKLNDEPKPVYKIGFIREKGKATARALQQSPEASNSLLRRRLGFYRCFNSGLWVVFSMVVHFKGFLR